MLQFGCNKCCGLMVGEETEQDYQDYQLELEAHTFPLLPYRII